MCSDHLESEATADVNFCHDVSYRHYANLSSLLNYGVPIGTTAVSSYYSRLTSTFRVEYGVSIRISYYFWTYLDRRRCSYKPRAHSEHSSYAAVISPRIHSHIRTTRRNYRYSIYISSHLAIAANVHYVAGRDFLYLWNFGHSNYTFISMASCSNYIDPVTARTIDDEESTNEATDYLVVYFTRKDGRDLTLSATSNYDNHGCAIFRVYTIEFDLETRYTKHFADDYSRIKCTTHAEFIGRTHDSTRHVYNYSRSVFINKYFDSFSANLIDYSISNYRSDSFHFSIARSVDYHYCASCFEDLSYTSWLFLSIGMFVDLDGVAYFDDFDSNYPTTVFFMDSDDLYDHLVSNYHSFGVFQRVFHRAASMSGNYSYRAFGFHTI